MLELCINQETKNRLIFVHFSHCKFYLQGCNKYEDSFISKSEERGQTKVLFLNVKNKLRFILQSGLYDKKLFLFSKSALYN